MEGRGRTDDLTQTTFSINNVQRGDVSLKPMHTSVCVLHYINFTQDKKVKASQRGTRAPISIQYPSINQAVTLHY